MFPLLWFGNCPFDVSNPIQEKKFLSYIISQNREIYSQLTGRLTVVRHATFYVYGPLTGVSPELRP